jgi:hypothetical protein
MAGPKDGAFAFKTDDELKPCSPNDEQRRKAVCNKRTKRKSECRQSDETAKRQQTKHSSGVSCNTPSRGSPADDYELSRTRSLPAFVANKILNSSGEIESEDENGIFYLLI